MGLLTLVHTHSVMQVLSVIAFVKYAKYQMICWRRDVVNRQVRELTDARFDASSFDYDEVSASLVCAMCKSLLRRKRSYEDYGVGLCDCGCVLHHSCLMMASMKQHGIAAPNFCGNSGKVLDFDHLIDDLFNVMRRFFGIDSIVVNELECPHCRTLNRSWKVLFDPKLMLQDLEESLSNGGPSLFTLLRYWSSAVVSTPISVKWVSSEPAIQSEEEEAIVPQVINSTRELTETPQMAAKTVSHTVRIHLMDSGRQGKPAPQDGSVLPFSLEERLQLYSRFL